MKPKRILLAEDDPMLSTLLSYRLQKSGFEVKHMGDGQMIKLELNECLPDAIVCDIMMPYYSGLEILAYVRNELKSDIPFILISSASNESNVSHAFDLGVSDFIGKPLSVNVLQLRIEKAIENHELLSKKSITK